jgi:L-2,4-diaminobutyrate transaminase
VRGVGLLAALEFVADKETKASFDPALKIGAKVAAAALDEGMIARAMPHGDILGFAPPLVLKPEEADRIVAMTKKAVDRVQAAL